MLRRMLDQLMPSYRGGEILDFMNPSLVEEGQRYGSDEVSIIRHLSVSHKRQQLFVVSAYLASPNKVPNCFCSKIMKGKK